MKPWTTLSRRTLLAHSRFLTVEEHTVQLPDGRVIENWPWLVTPDYVNVAAITAEGKFLCFRQMKYPLSEASLAAVGGYIEPGEDPLQAAQRELLEETGYEAAEWLPLGSYWVDANRGMSRGHFFLARQAYRAQPPHADDLEEQELLELSRDELATALSKGDFKIMAWAAILALALNDLANPHTG